MKFDSLQAGGTYYTVSRHRAGNTTMRTVSVHSVKVISTDTVKQLVVASWNGNPRQTFYEHEFKSWRATRPLLVGECGVYRLANREEIAAAKAKEQSC